MNIQTLDSPIAVAEAAARHAVDTLHDAITTHGSASWVLAGGTAPNLAYGVLQESYLDRLDWSKVTFIIGDERIGSLNGSDNNWQTIEQLFLQHIPEATFLRPQSDLSAEEAASRYEKQLKSLARADHDVPRFNFTWLGMGPDGHTLSLFPNHVDFKPDDARLVTPVHNSPKPPADRISLTLHALQGSEQTVIIATGESKRKALTEVFSTKSTLPIAQAAAIGNHTLWFIDELARP